MATGLTWVKWYKQIPMEVASLKATELKFKLIKAKNLQNSKMKNANLGI